MVMLSWRLFPVDTPPPRAPALSAALRVGRVKFVSCVKYVKRAFCAPQCPGRAEPVIRVLMDSTAGCRRKASSVLSHERRAQPCPRVPTTPMACLQSLGRRGAARLMHDSFTLEVPRMCAVRLEAVLREGLRRPCVVVARVQMGAAVAEASVVERAGEKTFVGDTSAAFDAVRLSADGVALRDTPNAGGASVRSEVMSMEILKRAFGATLLATEMQAWYWPAHSPITDYVCTLNGETVGVSVTRAFHFVSSALFTAADARRLLAKKLQGVLNSTKAIVYPEFKRQVLHVFCRAQRVAELVLREYRSLGCELRGNTVLFLTVCEADWIYTERALVPQKVSCKKKKPVPERQRRTRVRDKTRKHKTKSHLKHLKRWCREALSLVAMSVLFALMLLLLCTILPWLAWSSARHYTTLLTQHTKHALRL